MRPYAPMTRDDVTFIQTAGRRVKALEFLINLSLQRGLKESARLAQQELAQLKREVYQKFDIRL